MHLNADISSALQLLEDIKETIDDLNDPKLEASTREDLLLLISALENPIFRSIVTIQDSFSELNQQLSQHPSILPADFDFTSSGDLEINVPPGGELFDPGYSEEFNNSEDYDEQRVPSAPVSPGSPQVHKFHVSEDKVLLVDGKPLDPNISHQEALRLLQKAQGLAIVQRNEDDVRRSPSAISDASKDGSDTLLNTEYVQVEAIDLVNDGTGLGFGIVGIKSKGVVVKTILPGGVADRDNKLQSGDHILQIGEVNLHEMRSEQVATVLRQSGTHVRLVVARPADLTVSSPEYKYLSATAPLVPTKLITNPIELDNYLIQHSYPPVFNRNCEYFDQSLVYSELQLSTSPSLPLLNLDLGVVMPEMETFTVELKKDHNGLGITIAGYVCEKEELSGIFVKSVSKGSAADLSGKIQVNDRIVEVDKQSLQGYTNLQAVEVLRSSGNIVLLCLERYLHGPKFDQLQQAIAASELKPASSSAPRIPRFPLTKEEDYSEEAFTKESIETKNELANYAQQKSIEVIDLTPAIENALKIKWSKIMGENIEIVIARLTKYGAKGGLGISLEGTVDVEDGLEVRPHHYIRSILPEGPVGRNGKLKSGDELLEVNGNRLLGMNHHEVVSILKELPITVRIVCGRNLVNSNTNYRVSSQNLLFSQRGALGGSLQNLLPASDRLVKAKSDGSLTTSISTIGNLEPAFTKIKSRSLEPLTGLAMWSSEPQIIELMKGERGLGFSILDYQDPIDPNDTVIVIRSLVPGGVAQLDGRLIPGDRLMFVNDTVLENASLDQAVQALKGAPKGIVRIGVAKPLPVPDTVTHSAQQLRFEPVRIVRINTAQSP